jgi:formylglycine-generating enzyme required for sulfatase activity
MPPVPDPRSPSPFAARVSTRSPQAAAEPVGTGAAGPRQAGGTGKVTKLLFAGALAALVLGSILWWSLARVNGPGPEVAVLGESTEREDEPPEIGAERLARDFEALRLRASLLRLDGAGTAALAQATVEANRAVALSASGDSVGAAAGWSRAVDLLGPVVEAVVKARYEEDAASLQETRPEDSPATAVSELFEAVKAAERARDRGEWAEAVRRRDEARELIGPARLALAGGLAELGRAAAARGDEALATLFHQRALRLDATLEISRDHLYRHKFSPGQILRSAGGLEFAYVPPAEFVRGSPGGETGRDEDETPHRVRLKKGFFLAVNETTQREWDRVFGAGAAARMLRAAKARPETISPELPVHSVTWEEAVEYCRLLSEQERMAFRLPTEAEWEFACRAGTTTAFNLGTDGLSAREANIDDGSAGAPLAPRAPGASGPANAWGLRDMHGNVWEWCADWSAEYAGGADVALDPRGPGQDELGRIDLAMKVVRGGGWNAPANDARSANRWEYSPAVATGYIGLRVAHDPDLAAP